MACDGQQAQHKRNLVLKITYFENRIWNTQKSLFSRKNWWWFGGNAKFGAKYDFWNPENQTRTGENLDEHSPLGPEAERALPNQPFYTDLCA